MNNATSLQAKILAINTINRHTSEIVEHEIEQLKNLIGTNPLKVDGSFKAKIKHEKKVIEKQKINAFGFDWWIDTTYYLTAKYGYFVACIRTCVSGGGADRNGVNAHCIYESKEPDLFKIDKDGNFQEIDRTQDDLLQYDEAELYSIAREIKAIAEQYSEALNKMPSQFRYVLNIERLTR